MISKSFVLSTMTAVGLSILSVAAFAAPGAGNSTLPATHATPAVSKNLIIGKDLTVGQIPALAQDGLKSDTDSHKGIQPVICRRDCD
jgi:hypothetical protein